MSGCGTAVGCVTEVGGAAAGVAVTTMAVGVTALAAGVLVLSWGVGTESGVPLERIGVLTATGVTAVPNTDGRSVWRSERKRCPGASSRCWRSAAR